MGDTWPKASFELTFDGPYLTGKPDRAGVDCMIHAFNVPANEAGVQGWALSIAEERGCRIARATTDGTNEGAVAACIPSPSLPVFLNPADSPHRVLKLELAPNAAGCQDCTVVYRDNLQGSGSPVKNLITQQGIGFFPALPPPLDFNFCEVESCYPFSPPPNGWLAQDLGTAAGGSSRNSLLGMFELCSAGTGHGGTSDSLRLVTQPLFWSLVGIRGRLEDLSPGGIAGVEIRSGAPRAANAACLRLTAARAQGSSTAAVTSWELAW